MILVLLWAWVKEYSPAVLHLYVLIELHLHMLIFLRTDGLTTLSKVILILTDLKSESVVELEHWSSILLPGLSYTVLMIFVLNLLCPVLIQLALQLDWLIYCFLIVISMSCSFLDQSMELLLHLILLFLLGCFLISVCQCGILNLTTVEMDFHVLEIHTLQEWDWTFFCWTVHYWYI